MKAEKASFPEAAPRHAQIGGRAEEFKPVVLFSQKCPASLRLAEMQR